MSKIEEFPRSVIEEIGYYVYSLTDPRTDEVFYIGKGTGNRVFEHAAAAIDSVQESDKLSEIREIQEAGSNVRHEILRHGMSEDQAFEVEAALIDHVGLSELANLVSGHDTNSRGRMTLVEIVATYEARPITIEEPALLLRVNRLYRRNMPESELFEITRGNWVLGERRNNVEYALSVYKGIVRQAYKVNRWHQVKARSKDAKTQNRWRFDGEIAQELQHYVGGDVGAYIKRGAQSPIKYINC